MLTDYTQWANPLQGTDSDIAYSHGNTLPFIGAPFAMTSWAIQTSEDRWYFHPKHRKIEGFRATRQASPWMGDYGHFLVMPQAGERRLSPGSRSSVYRRHDATFLPQYMQIFLGRYEINVELTATAHSSIMRIQYPRDSSAKRFLLNTYNGQAHIEIDESKRMVRGYTRANSGGTRHGFAGYFAIQFDCPIDKNETALFHDDRTFTNQGDGNIAGTGDRIGAYVGLLPKDDCLVHVRIGTSFISMEQAERNLAREVGGRSFDEVRQETADLWNNLLGRIEIDGCTDEQRKTFYSCLYRSCLYPRQMHEYDEQGKKVHYSQLDGQIHDGDFCTDNGFWDTHRTVYPLFSILCPDKLQEIMRGWVNHYVEGGWLPRWPSPGETGGMIGTHIDAVIADACTKNIGGFDLEKAFEGMMRHATERAPGGRGRPGIEDFDRLGYAPMESAGHAVSSTLDYAYDDFCVGLVAAALGRKKEQEMLWRRAFNYRNIYDPTVGFMRGRHADGSWDEPFNEFDWGGPYVEGSAWQCSWAVPHDPAGLAQLLGGDNALVDKLDQMMSLPPRFNARHYGNEIHEMTEMACADFGQYAHSNQPVHHVLYLYAAAGRPDRTQYYVRRVLNEMYGPDIDGFPGDEDNGSMASWYVLSALGIFPLCPGLPSYVFGSPLFKKAVIHLQSGKDLTIEAPANSQENVFVAQVLRNGKVSGNVTIQHADLVEGGTLTFEMTDHAVWTEIPEPANRPFSLSIHKKA